MDITFEHAFPDTPSGADVLRRLARPAALAALFGSLAVWGAAGALAAGPQTGFAHGPVAVTSDAGPMFSLPALAPGRTVTRYATVTSTGSTASVRLFATVTGTGLARFLTLTVTRGAGGADAFVPDVGRRATVFHGRLSDFPSAWNDALDVGAAWRADRPVTFRFEVRMTGDRAGQALTAGADFHWEARGA